MLVRVIHDNEILPALHLAWEVYASEIAPLQRPEAVAGFQQFIRYDSILPSVQRGELTLFGAWEGRELCGVSGIDHRGAIRLFYVRKHWQRKGIGRALMQSMCQFCSQTLVITRITAKVFPSAVAALTGLGMRETAPVQNLGTDTFVPMEMMISPGAMQPGRNRKKTIVIAGCAAILCIALILLLAGMVYHEARRVAERSRTYDYEMPFELDPYGGYGEEGDEFDWYDWYGEDFFGGGEEEESLSGIDLIPEYEESGLSFEVREESYLESPDDTKTTYIDFEVYYPQIEGLGDAGLQEKINTELKDCAMETVGRIYEDPDPEIKERVIGEEYPVIADYVKYKVTYLSEDYLSVVFEDYSYEGSEEAFYVGLRTKNISLKDGTVYEVRDIVDLRGAFIDEWLAGMRSEAETDSLLSELDAGELTEALSGSDTQGDVYLPAFFADADGLEIGLSFHYPKGDENDRGYGWVTAPFELEELRDYQTENGYWELVK